MYWKAARTRKSCQRWTTKLIKKLLGIAWDMWQHCNEALHEDPENRPQILETEVNQNVTELYGLGQGAFANSTSLFKHPLIELLQLPLAYKSHWLETVKIAKAQKDRRKADPYQQEQRSMQIWLTSFNSTVN